MADNVFLWKLHGQTQPTLATMTLIDYYTLLTLTG